ncbi:MAG: hypothetical protein LAN84_15810 [Acidobacteriia bacterium]|nr:hypothetical protein [Terriglobia bacterium]
MSSREKLSGFPTLPKEWKAVLLTGVRTGISLSLVLAVWLLLANRIPFLERFAWERNIAAAAALALLALLPPVRFFPAPWRMLVCSLTAWMIFSFAYRGCFLFFPGLTRRIGAFHVFMLGAVVYTIVATLTWIGTFIWSVRDHHVSQTRHHLS